MKLFSCTRCSNVVYFENRTCERCDSRLGYFPPSNILCAIEPDGNDWRCVAPPTSDMELPPDVRLCANAEYGACNWLIPGDSTETFCAVCRHNHVIPDLSDDLKLCQWRKFELAKHHLFYGLLRLKLPLATRQEEPAFGLTFDVLADDAGVTVLTGHQDGVITLNLAEADDATREQRRSELGEPYRTLLGHLRHEVGHYYWDRLVSDGGRLEEFRELFGDERRDYGEALQEYYAKGPPADWRETFVSAYASAHPWEDFAETWAHFLHIVDTMEMARSFGIRVDPVVTDNAAYTAEVDLDPHATTEIRQLVKRWLPIAAAVNSINRCMGQPDLYPFVLTPAVIEKLGFVRDLIRRIG